MAGKALASFADFVLSTNENKFTSPTDIINDFVNRTYTMSDAMRGRDNDEIVKDGSTITDRWQGLAGTQFEPYDPNTVFAPYIEDILSKLQAPWRFVKDCFVWTDHEVELNEGDRRIQYAKLAKSKRQGCEISQLNGIESLIWATPNSATMESLTTQGGRPYSIPSFIAENGIQPAGWTTTILQLDPTVSTRWQNQVSNYIAASIDTSLQSAFEEMHLHTTFDDTANPEYLRPTRKKKVKWYTNLDGWKTFVRLIRNSNDRNYPTNDAGYAVEKPMFDGSEIKWIEALENFGYAIGQPRYFRVDYEFLFPVWNSKRYMKELDPMVSPYQPFTHVVYKDTWYNWFCRSRYRQGILVPV